MTGITAYPDMAAAAAALADRVAGQIGDALRRRGRATVALAGGTTPAPFLHALARRPLDWTRVAVLPTDERIVPADSPRLNAGLLRRALLRGAAAGAALLPLVGPLAPAQAETVDPARLARLAALRLAPFLPLDVCVLGMGEDGHTASLFPHADGLAEALSPEAPAVLPVHAPAAPEPRLTLTAPVLLGARHLHLLIAGPAKLAVLKRAREPGPVEDMPVRLVLSAPQGLAIHHAEGGAP